MGLPRRFKLSLDMIELNGVMKLNLFFEMQKKGKTLVISYLKTIYNSDAF